MMIAKLKKFLLALFICSNLLFSTNASTASDNDADKTVLCTMLSFVLMPSSVVFFIATGVHFYNQYMNGQYMNPDPVVVTN